MHSLTDVSDVAAGSGAAVTTKQCVLHVERAWRVVYWGYYSTLATLAFMLVIQFEVYLNSADQRRKKRFKDVSLAPWCYVSLSLALCLRLAGCLPFCL